MGRKIKKLLSVLLAAAMLITAAPLAGYALSEEDTLNYLEYEINDGEVTITDCDTSIRGELTIPPTIEGYPVTVIGEYAFSNCTGLTKVTLPYMLYYIFDGAFNRCTGLTSITIPENVFYLGVGVFIDCYALTSVTLSKSITFISPDLFFGCDNLTEITIPNKVTSIGEFAFNSCTRLKSVNIPDGVTSIGHYAFEVCTGLKSVTIPRTVTEIGMYAFGYNDGEKNNDFKIYCYSGTAGEEYALENGFDYEIIDDSELSCFDYEINNGEVTITRCDTSISGELTIPSAIEGYPVTSIGVQAFYSCTELTNITIPDSVIFIGNYAFHNCIALKSICIPNSVNSIGNDAFSFCNELTSITIPDTVKNIGDCAFDATGYYNNDENWENDLLYIGNHLIKARYEINGSCTIKSGTRAIANNAFEGCSGLTSITIPDSVTTMGTSLFYNCNGLTSITISNAVKYIGSFTFCRCTDLSNITIPDSITYIADYSFYDCNSLNQVTIPSTVTQIGDYAFGYIDSYSMLDDASGGPTPERKSDFKIYCYSGTAGEEYALENGFDYEIIDDSELSCFDYEINNGEVTITRCDTSISGELTIPSTIEGYPVTSIGVRAFEGCTGLTSITIPDSVTSIGVQAFYNCTELTNIAIPDSVTFIGDYAFSKTAYYNNKANWEDNVLYIDHHLIQADNSKISGAYKIKNGTKTIAGSAFYSCDITEIVIPNSVISICYSAFYKCYNLTNVSMFNGVKNIYDNAFLDCWGLKSIVIPESVTWIAYKAIGYNNSEDYFLYKVPNFKIYCYSGTAGEQYAIENEFDYEILSDTHTHTPVLVTVPATCTVDGMKYYICDECGETIGTPEVIKANGHSFGDWVVTLEPTTEKEGLKTRTCTLCGAKETQKIEKLKKLVDDKTGVEIVYNDQFENDVKVEVTQVFDGQSIQLINTEFGEVNTAIYDITTTQDGVKVQPSGSVTVRVPVPADFKGGNIFACYVDSVNGKVIKIPATVVGGYVEFTVEHFSEYALVYGKGTVKSVSVDDIEMNYKKSATLNTVIGVDEGVNYTVEYSSSDPSVAKVDENGNVYGAKKGSAEITVTVTDEFGNVASDTCNVEVKYSFGQWLIVILLFGWIWY